MAHIFSELKLKRWVQNLKKTKSTRRVVVGVTLFLFSIVMLWAYERRVDMAEVIRGSYPVPAHSVSIDKRAGRRFVSITGELVAKTPYKPIR